MKAGDLLVEIDPRDLAVQLEQKRAALNAARANREILKASFELRRAQVATAQAATKQSAAEATAERRDKARSDLKRAQDLVQKRTISPQEFDSAKAAATAAEANLKAARRANDQRPIEGGRGQGPVGNDQQGPRMGRSANPPGARPTCRPPNSNLSYARVTAPIDGYVTKKAVETGDYVQVGQRLMALVPHELFVTANYKETELAHIRPGQKVQITVDSAGGRAFAGHVDSIMAGSGARFSLLPPENAVGNYVKVVQRIPVKILFDEPVEAEHVLGPGMSVVPSVHVKGYVISETVIVIVAAVGGAGGWGAVVAGGVARKREA